jgi:CubicO group peptidase (beta-lactamase class C family)
MITRRTAATILFTTLLAAPPVAAQDAGDRIRAVEEGLHRPTTLRGQDAPPRLDERMQALGVPGVSIAVIEDGRIAWAKGYGVTRAGGTLAVDTATLFQAASISKPVAAMAALRLVEQGVLDLDGDVNARLSSWHVEDNRFTTGQKVTLRRLLSHNAGLTVHGFRGYAAGEDVPTLVQLLSGQAPANSAAVRPDTVPGSLWRYSGGGSSVAQLLMQEVTGRSFPDLVAVLVLQPVAMHNSTYEQPLPEHRAATAATGHLMNGQPVNGRWHTYPEMFAAGLWTTPSDLARLAIEVQRSADGRSDRVLSQAMTREMLSLHAGDYGLGFGLQNGDGYTAFSHGGANQGFRAMFFALTDGRGAVVMTNSDNGAVLAGEIIRAVAHAYDWPVMRSIERDVVALTDAQVAELAGAYEFRRGEQTLAFRIAAGPGGTLRFYGPPFGERTLYATDDDAFSMLESTALLRFERDRDGNVSGVAFDGVRARRR